MKLRIKRLMLMLMMSIIGILAFIKPVLAVPSDAEWVPFNFYSNVWGMRLIVTYTQGMSRLSFTVPYSDYNLYDNGGIDSEIFFSGGTNTGSVLFSDINTTNQIAKTYDLYLDDVDGTNFLETTQVIIYIMQDFTSVPSQYYEYYNTNRFVEINANAIEIIVVAGLTIHQRIYFYEGHTIPTPSTAPTLTNLQFQYWALRDGTQYDFTYIPSGIETGYLGPIGSGASGGILGSLRSFYVYGVYTRTDLGSDVGTPTDNTPTGIGLLLNAFGLDNDSGKIFLYFLLIAIATIILLLYKMNTFVIMITDFLITILFMWLGWLPVFASIILSMIYILIFMVSTKSEVAT